MSEFFEGIEKIAYEGPDSKNPLAFKHYDAEATVGGKTMAEHLRFSVAFWHSFKGGGIDPFGPTPVYDRPWDRAADPMQRAEDTLRAAFEFITKLGAPFYCWHDRDIAPEGETLKESNDRLDHIVGLAEQLQADTGVRLLWGTSNCFSHARFTHGAATNPDAHVFAWAAAQIKKAMECTHRLGGANYVFWGGREGYSSLLNTNMAHEQDQLARFLHMAVEHKKAIGFTGTLLVEPKPKEPTKHQYDYDAATVLSFLRKYDLLDEFKLNIEANHATLAGHTFEHDLQLASADGKLGSIDANRGDYLLGWDTDQFPTDLYSATYAMLVILKQGGIASWRHQLRRQGATRLLRLGGSLPRPHRRHGLVCSRDNAGPAHHRRRRTRRLCGSALRLVPQRHWREDHARRDQLPRASGIRPPARRARKAQWPRGNAGEYRQ